jgi:hypothetical protein
LAGGTLEDRAFETPRLRTAETRKPKEKAPAVTPRSHPNSSRIGGKSREKAVRALTPTPHGDEGDGHDDPAVEEGHAHDAGFYRGAPHQGRPVFRSESWSLVDSSVIL